MFSIAEVTREQRSYNFATGLRGDSWVCAWVHKRGALNPDSTDGGQDLVVMTQGGFPTVVVSGAKSISTPSFDDNNGRYAFIKDGKELVIGSSVTNETQTWLALPSDEKFSGSPAWAGTELMFATDGGSPKRTRLHVINAPKRRSGSPKQQR